MCGYYLDLGWLIEANYNEKRRRNELANFMEEYWISIELGREYASITLQDV